MMVARPVTPKEFDQVLPADADRAAHLEHQATQAQHQLAEARAVAEPDEPRIDGGSDENDGPGDHTCDRCGDRVDRQDHWVHVSATHPASVPHRMQTSRKTTVPTAQRRRASSSTRVMRDGGERRGDHD